MVRGSLVRLTQQQSAGVGPGKFALLLDFEQLTIIVDSLVSRGSREKRMSKVKAVDCLYSRQRAN